MLSSSRLCGARSRHRPARGLALEIRGTSSSSFVGSIPIVHFFPGNAVTTGRALPYSTVPSEYSDRMCVMYDVWQRPAGGRGRENVRRPTSPQGVHA